MAYLDIYFRKEYGKLYESVEKGRLEVFEYKSDYGCIKNMFIKREIPVINDNETYYDIITPYGYGGPIIVNCSDQSKREKLVTGYYDKFKNYCKKNNIVSEFIRFHPIYNNYYDFQKVYDVKFSRKTIGTNLKSYEDPIQSEFARDCRRKIRKSLRLGVSYEILKSPEDLDLFKQIYYQTMDRNHAKSYYYFDEKYFNSMIKDLKNELLLVNVIFEKKVIGSKICFISNGLIHCHLSGSLIEYDYLSPSFVLEYATVRWGKENGFDYVHHGGGRTNNENDLLLRYKKNFGKNTSFNFYVAEKIYDIDKYYEICDKFHVNPKSDFFPAYRCFR